MLAVSLALRKISGRGRSVWRPVSCRWHLSSQVEDFSDERAAKSLLVDLNKQIVRHDRLYYGEDSPEISDAEFDALIQRAAELEKSWPSLEGTLEKLRTVGYKANEKFGTIEHQTRLLSLDNAFNSHDLDKFMVRCEKDIDDAGGSSTPLELVVEPKLDGLSISLIYRSGSLVSAATRGDGFSGENVTANVLNTTGIPQALFAGSVEGGQKICANVDIRGEVYISRENFQVLNEVRAADNLTAFANPRNAAAGSLRQIDPTVSWARPLNFVAYDVQSLNDSDFYDEYGIHSQTEALEWLESVGFKTPNPRALFGTFNDSSKLPTFLARMLNERHEWAYDADGSVIKVNDFAQRQLIGDGARSPSWAIAYKFPGDEGITTVQDIVVQVGRTGALTPVAVLDPVTIGGVVVERATLHNQQELTRLGMHKGARVLVLRSGDVIPKIVTRLDADGQRYEDYAPIDEGCFQIPSSCPVCGSLARVDDGGVIIRCSGGLACSAQIIERVRHFCSKTAADLPGLGLSTLEELYALGLVREPADLYRLKDMDVFRMDDDAVARANENRKARMKAARDAAKAENADASAAQLDRIVDEDPRCQSMLERKGWGLKSVGGLLEAIESRRRLRYDKFLFGLGVRHVGMETAKDIATSTKFPTFRELWAYLEAEATRLDSNCTIDQNDIARDLQSIDGLGPKAANALLSLYANEASRRAVENLLSEVEVIPMERRAAVPTGDGSELLPLVGRRVVFTGRLAASTRSEAERLCVALGGVTLSSMTRDADLVVAAGDINSAKAEKAREWGIETWTEDDWQSLLEKHGNLIE